MKPLPDHSITELAPRIAARQVSAAEITDACLDRIALENGRLNAFITVLADRAREDARRADEEIAAGRHRGPLHGIPLSLKDLIDLAGAPTTAASRVLEATSRARMRPSPPASGTRAPSSSGRTTSTSSRSGPRARTPRSGPFTIPGTRSGRPAGRAAGRPPRSSRAWASPPSAPTPGARSGFPPPRAGVSA